MSFSMALKHGPWQQLYKTSLWQHLSMLYPLCPVHDHATNAAVWLQANSPPEQYKRPSLLCTHDENGCFTWYQQRSQSVNLRAAQGPEESSWTPVSHLEGYTPLKQTCSHTALDWPHHGEQACWSISWKWPCSIQGWAWWWCHVKLGPPKIKFWKLS